MNNTRFSIIVACTNEGGIGKDNTIPWYLPDDLKHFKKVTTSCPEGLVNVIIMGRNTWESLPRKPLPSRINIVVSSQLHLSNESTYVVKSLNDALELAASLSNIYETFVIGGSRLYKEALEHPQCDKAYVTHVHSDYECNVYFPLETLHKSFTQVKCENSNDNNITCTFNTYLRHKNLNIIRYS